MSLEATSLELSPNLKIHAVSHPLADIWIASEDFAEADYHYGGTRMVGVQSTDNQAIATLTGLAIHESGIKNRLVNRAFSGGVLDPLVQRLPRGLRDSRVLGGRCVFRPRTAEAERLFSQVAAPEFTPAVESLFASIGGELNRLGGRVKLTPDFGRYAHLADTLGKFTEHTLGVRCEDGGCGGKSSYTTTGIVEAFETLEPMAHSRKVTLIGSAGALGSEFLEYLRKRNAFDVAVADIAYNANEHFEGAEELLPSQPGCFTDECLSRGGILVATTIGHELENSDWSRIPRGTLVLLAHNAALPTNPVGVRIARELAANGVLVVPGPLLTLGGALTSRVEWFWRQNNRGIAFDKPLAHEIVRCVTSFLWKELTDRAATDGSTPFEAMYALSR